MFCGLRHCPGATGVQPEWFYKGDGSALVPPGGDLVSPTVLAITMYVLTELTRIAIKRSGR